MTTTPSKNRFIYGLLAAAVIAAGGVGLLWQQQTMRAHSALLVAPMIGVVEPCLAPPPGGQALPEGLVASCSGSAGSASDLIHETLSGLGLKTNSQYRLGYTLPVALLDLFERPDGQAWAIRQGYLQRLVRTIADSPLPLVLYLFSTHFEVGSALEQQLAQDPDNLAHTPQGPLATDRYYNSSIYNWSVAHTDNTLTHYRSQAVAALLDAVCALPAQQRQRIEGITLLGETHQLFPDFQAGMGFEQPYLITDYSEASHRGFRAFLAKRYPSIAHLNQALGSDYPSFDAVRPPGKNIRQQPLQRFHEHIDAYAHGFFPVSGWAYSPGQHKPRVQLWLDGQWLASTTADLNRQDVLAARPDLGHANTGWRMDVDFRQLPPGQHLLEVFLEQAPGQWVRMGQRRFSVVDRQQSPVAPLIQPSAPRPTVEAGKGVAFWMDFPIEQADYYYNPLVPLWHAFRAQQVTRYIDFFDRQLAQSCLAPVPRYTHQIMPLANPSWDATRFAIEDSLRPHPSRRLGISLYGEASYGRSFQQWLKASGQRTYGVTEFHPLKPLPAQALAKVLDQHHRQGAQFLSFFLEPQWQGQLVPRPHNQFSLNPHNPLHSSDQLYRSMQEVLGAPTQKKQAVRALQTKQADD